MVALDHPVLGKRNHPLEELLFWDIVVVVEQKRFLVSNSVD